MIENLGKIDLVLTSMTGTLTDNQTSLKKIFYNGKAYNLEGSWQNNLNLLDEIYDQCKAEG